jgi:demethylmenaquinone methyltransferase / 2-methoxy-6-polyprenyl-1,4-benzoquinol methylase
VSKRTAHARELFAPLGPTYDRYGALLSFGQDPRWRRFLVSRVEAGPHDTVLDVATGTAAVALELVRQKDCFVWGVDQSPEMLEIGRRRVALAAASKQVRLVEGSADGLPFEDGQFDALTFTYLLRYVDDPAATVRELARVVKPGGTVAMVEFGVPPRPVLRALWRHYTRVWLPALGRLLSREWQEVGRFLGPNIEGFYARVPLPSLVKLWERAGLTDVRVRRMSFGAGVVMTGVKRR